VFFFIKWAFKEKNILPLFFSHNNGG
jgi:hypothetical protein